MARDTHIGPVFFLCGIVLAGACLSGAPAYAQTAHNDVTESGCSQEELALGYHRRGFAACGGSYREADPYLRYGAELTTVDPNGGHFDYERLQAARTLPKPPHDLDEIAAIVVNIYGTRSVLSRSVRSIAELSDAAELRSQAALTGLNTATNWVVVGARRVFHARNLPDFRFRSKIRRHYLGLGIQARW